MSSLYIVIPAYNESENIEKTIDQWYQVVERHNDEGESRLVIINDGSKDNTSNRFDKTVKSRYTGANVVATNAAESNS